MSGRDDSGDIDGDWERHKPEPDDRYEHRWGPNSDGDRVICTKCEATKWGRHHFGSCPVPS